MIMEPVKEMQKESVKEKPKRKSNTFLNMVYIFREHCILVPWLLDLISLS